MLSSPAVYRGLDRETRPSRPSLGDLEWVAIERVGAQKWANTCIGIHSPVLSVVPEVSEDRSVAARLTPIQAKLSFDRVHGLLDETSEVRNSIIPRSSLGVHRFRQLATSFVKYGASYILKSSRNSEAGSTLVTNR